jgi:hypothetical protein
LAAKLQNILPNTINVCKFFYKAMKLFYKAIFIR